MLRHFEGDDASGRIAYQVIRANRVYFLYGGYILGGHGLNSVQNRQMPVYALRLQGIDCTVRPHRM